MCDCTRGFSVVFDSGGVRVLSNCFPAFNLCFGYRFGILVLSLQTATKTWRETWGASRGFAKEDCLVLHPVAKEDCLVLHSNNQRVYGDRVILRRYRFPNLKFTARPISQFQNYSEADFKQAIR
jgi:hypothetical protein